MRELNIGGKLINDSSPCFVVAEIGNNHQGNLAICKEMFRAASDCGVDAAKLQKRDNENLYTNNFYNTPYNSENAFGPTYGLHRKGLEFGEGGYIELQRVAQEKRLIFFATAFDFNSADFLERLGVPCYKTASGDLTNVPLLKHIAEKGKPIIISTGAATLDDVCRAYEAVAPINGQIGLLQCTAVYPAEPRQLDLRVIETYRKKFPGAVVGLSDHYNGIALPVAAFVLGARIIEKHFTLNHTMKGTDHAFSLEPAGMKKLVRDLNRTHMALGDGVKKFCEEEKPARLKMGKKIVAARDLSIGHALIPSDFAFKSPGDGLEPYLAEEFYGKTLIMPLAIDDTLAFEHIKTP